MKIPALSIWQPWASLIAQGQKQFETRSWATHYRGQILICAAAKKVPAESYHFINWQLQEVGEHMSLKPKDFPLGVAVGIACLVDCKPTDHFYSQVSDKEICLGNWSDGRFAWKLEEVKAILPFPVKGQQGIFYVEIDEPVTALEGTKTSSSTPEDRRTLIAQVKRTNSRKRANSPGQLSLFDVG